MASQPAWRAKKALEVFAGERRAAQNAADGKRPRVTESVPDPSGESSQRAERSPRRGSCCSRQFGSDGTYKKSEERIDQIARFSLESQDVFREVQARLGYVVFLMPGDSEISKTVEEEVKAFREFTKAARDKADEASEAAELVGAQAAHVFPATVVALLENDTSTATAEDQRHRPVLETLVKSLQEAADQSSYFPPSAPSCSGRATAPRTSSS